jgi:class 3 adenylate cyclase
MNGQTLQGWAGSLRPNLALLFTDIIDSTTLGSNQGDATWVPIIKAHIERARRLMYDFDCYEIKFIGDSFMIAFRNAVDALDFTLALKDYTGHESIRIRAGIHVGPVRVEENDLLGMMVNYTKRIEGEARGTIVLSEEAYNDVQYEKAQQHSHLKYKSRDFTAKGFDQPKRIWYVLRHLQVKRHSEVEANKVTADESNRVTYRRPFFKDKNGRTGYIDIKVKHGEHGEGRVILIKEGEIQVEFDANGKRVDFPLLSRQADQLEIITIRMPLSNLS